MKTLLALLSVQAALLTGTPYSGDIHLLGVKEEFGIIFKITCFSCLKPYEESADFYINDVQIDAVRYSDGKCYHKRKLCDPIECTCSMDGNNFTLSISSGLSFLEFSCEMRFKDEATGKLSVQTAHLIFNETEFIPEVQRSRTIGFNENTQTKTDTTDANVIVSDDGQQNNKTLNVVGWILVVFVALFISVLTCIFPNTPGKISNWISRCISRRQYQNVGIREFVYSFNVNESKEDHVMFKKKCRVCENLTTCAICIECKQGFCDPCCDKHLKFDKNRLHKVYQIQHVATSQKITKCDITKCKKKAERVCISCWVQRCVSCVSKDHGDKCDKQEIIRIHQTTTPESPIPQTTVEQDNLKLLRTIPIQKDKYPVRIYGIEFLADGTLVAIDKNNKQIILFTADFKQQFEPLENEPRAMTAMAGSDIAVTFPCIQHIKIYAIYWNLKKDTATCEITKVIKMSNLDLHILKPFSITFNKDFFAVEVGEGEDGKIVIVDNNNNKTYNFPETIQWKFAYFTGHTIRLALAIDRKHMNNRPQGRLYMSTMSNKMVSCIDLEGNKVWEVSMPSPRSLIIVPKKHQFGDSIILSSRRLNAIYTLKKIEGKNEVLQASEIESPRYIACHFEKNTFCVLVKNKEKKDELAIFEFKNKTKQDDADKALEFNESTNLLHV